jgi:hypothetical protein
MLPKEFLDDPTQHPDVDKSFLESSFRCLRAEAKPYAEREVGLTCAQRPL